MKILLPVETNIKEVNLELNSDGYYHIELAWRYILKSGIVLDSILQDAGLRYIRRPPGEFFELWALIENPTRAYDHNGNIISTT
jgi:hypothetical protein